MKNVLLLMVVLLSIKVTYAQVPNQFNYQAVARNSQGQSIPNANIRTRFTILDGSANGTNVYSEVRLLTTNQLGLFTAAIGGSGATNVTGNFATIDWSTGKKFIKVEVDPLGGTSFLALGNTEMLSVPYALYAVNGKIGPVGPPNVLNVGTVLTGATGTPASATITGTSPTQTINLVLPTGANGKISLVKTTAEAVGVNCTVGGTKIEAGVDNNGNSTLDAAEVTNISYVCNGDVNNTWKITGNAGTTAANFIGTTDSIALTIKTNNTDAIKVLGNGNVGIGTISPVAKLEVSGQPNNTAIKTTGKNTFQGTGNVTEFFAGNNEDVVINPGKVAGKVFLNTSNSNTIISGINGKVGIANQAPQTTLDVYGNVKISGNAGYGSGLYSDNTVSNLTAGLGLNLVPIGVVSYYVNTTGGVTVSSEYKNVAGNLIISSEHWAEENVVASSGMGIELRLDPFVTNQYQKVIAIGSPSFIGSADAGATNTVMSAISQHFSPGRMTNVLSTPLPDEAETNLTYNKFTIEMIVDSWPITRFQYLHGTVMFYGIK